ncbi:MAG TPA: RDD family protein [Thermoanaerobaculia bacterium]|nr:RDD family protein [Thermoanaerobaculia bacterium]
MSPRRRLEQPSLFDLELDAPPASGPAVGEPTPAAAQAGDDGVPLRSRLYAGMVDLVAHVAVLAVVVLGVRLMGVAPEPRDLPAMLLLLLVFSLFFTVIPLAFWGRTPGMAVLGLVARCDDEQPLTFGQAARRWLAGLLTVAALGLPALLALRGRSLADRLSHSTLREG